MVEQWSSKPYAWVRFLLSLFIIPTYYKITLSKKQKVSTQINKFKSYSNISKPISLRLGKKLNLKLYNLKFNLNSKIKFNKRVTLFTSKFK